MVSRSWKLVTSFKVLFHVAYTGPCPPCPKTVFASCHCGSQAPVVRRCSAKSWLCGKPCGKLLSCGQHSCESPCHAGKKTVC